MDHEQFQEWLSGIDQLGQQQRREAEAVLPGASRDSASPAAVEAAMGEDRRCPRCDPPGAVSRGLTFDAATGTPLPGLHHKEKWLEYGTCLAEGRTPRQSAGHCGIAAGTSFRWRHRFLATQGRRSGRPTGIVEPGEACILESRKGERRLDRKARRRGLSHERAPVQTLPTAAA